MSEEDNDISSTVPESAPAARRERKPAAQHSAGFLTRLSQFLHDTRAEMRRVSWPTATEVRNTTIITLVAVIFFALYLFGVDRVWAFLIEHLRTWLGG
jgi:preprotein translocase SecE subunit